MILMIILLELLLLVVLIISSFVHIFIFISLILVMILNGMLFMLPFDCAIRNGISRCCSLLGMFTALAVAIIHFLIILIFLFISMSICFSCAFEFLTYSSNLLLLIFLLFLIPIIFIIMKLILDISTTPLLLNTPFPCDFHWIIECSQFRHQVCIEFLNILDINRITVITIVLFVFGDSTCSRPWEVKLLLRWLGILCRVKVNILRIRRRGILIGA